MDGIEALRFLRQVTETRNIPVIAVSAAAMPHDLERIQEAGFDAILSKPFNIQTVPALLAKYLGNSVARARILNSARPVKTGPPFTIFYLTG